MISKNMLHIAAFLLGASLTVSYASAAERAVLLAASGQSAGIEGGAGSSGESGTPPAQLRQQQTERENKGKAQSSKQGNSRNSATPPNNAASTTQGSH